MEFSDFFLAGQEWRQFFLAVGSFSFVLRATVFFYNSLLLEVIPLVGIGALGVGGVSETPSDKIVRGMRVVRRMGNYLLIIAFPFSKNKNYFSILIWFHFILIS